MDAVVSSEFQSDFPAEMAKAMVQTTLAVAAQVAIEAATKKQQMKTLASPYLLLLQKLQPPRLSHKPMSVHGIHYPKRY